MKNTKIIIEVKGSLVQAVYANFKEIEVDILDYDNINDDDATEEEKKAGKRLEGQATEMKQIY